MYFSWVRVLSAAATLLAGAALGAIGPFAGKFANPVCQTVALVFSVGWSWACFAFLVGYFKRSRIEAALLASSALAVGVIVYYVLKFLEPTVPDGGQVISRGSVEEELLPRILFWGTAAFVLGAPVGFAGNLARTLGVGGLPFRLVVPLIAFFEASERLGTEADSQGVTGEIAWNVIRVAAGVVAMTLAWHTVWRWWRARRSQPESRVEAGAPPKHL
ncbi:hypothetical protein ACQB60_28560 [Actinomycetota bacterium Odt1-20B]